MDIDTIRAARDLTTSTTTPNQQIVDLLHHIATAPTAADAATIAVQHAVTALNTTKLMALAGWNIRQAWPAANLAAARQQWQRYRQDTNVGTRWRFPSGATALVVNDRRQPHRLEVRSSSLAGDGIARDLDPTQVDNLLHQIAAL